MPGNNNGHPGAPWETPFGIIDEAGMEAITSFTWEYGEMSAFGGNGMSVCMYICLSICLTVCLFVCLFVCSIVCLVVWLFGCLSVCLIVC